MHLIGILTHAASWAISNLDAVVAIAAALGVAITPRTLTYKLAFKLGRLIGRTINRKAGQESSSKVWGNVRNTAYDILRGLADGLKKPEPSEAESKQASSP